MSDNGGQREDEASDQHFHDPERKDKARQTFVYEHSGIRERTGYVPYWLMLVVLLLTIWSIYYLLKHWTPAAAG